MFFQNFSMRIQPFFFSRMYLEYSSFNGNLILKKSGILILEAHNSRSARPKRNRSAARVVNSAWTPDHTSCQVQLNLPPSPSPTGQPRPLPEMAEPTLDVLPATVWEVEVTPKPETPTLRKRLGSPPLERQVLPGSSSRTAVFPRPWCTLLVGFHPRAGCYWASSNVYLN